MAAPWVWQVPVAVPKTTSQKVQITYTINFLKKRTSAREDTKMVSVQTGQRMKSRGLQQHLYVKGLKNPNLFLPSCTTVARGLKKKFNSLRNCSQNCRTVSSPPKDVYRVRLLSNSIVQNGRTLREMQNK